MSQRIYKQLTSLFFPLLLVCIGIVLCISNYTPHTFLIGWDNLNPEFNFPLAFQRVLSGVWRTDQGLGAVAIHSHMAELPRLMLLWLISLAFPLSQIRYTFMFLCLILGPLGVYKITKYIIGETQTAKALGLLAGLVYLANLVTLQQFVVPFEMFIVQFATVPWVLYLVMVYKDKPSRKRFFLFCALTIASSPMAYAATLWYGFFVCFIFFITLLYGRKNFWQGLLLISTTITVNLYWLLPNIYAAMMHGLDVKYSKINQLFSPEAFAKNQLFGNPVDTAIGKNFLFDWNIYNPQTQQFEHMLQTWTDHLSIGWIAACGYVLFGLSIIGIIWAIKTKNRKLLAFLPIYLISFCMMLNGTYPMTILFDQLSRISEVAKEALRLPFTKFSFLYILGLSLYASCGCYALTRILHKHLTICIAGGLGLVFWILLYFAPAFGGNLIHSSMRIDVPTEYFQMFDWFNRQDHTGRVALLPIHSFWNWVYYSWGYQGAGFLQFGIPQPILDRDYDRWTPYNEQYQREMSYAVYSQNPDNVNAVLDKYQVTWILVDTSVISPGSADSSTLTWFIPQLLEQTHRVEKAASFNKHITIYKVLQKNTAAMNFYPTLPSVGPTTIGGPQDTFYQQYGPYITQKQDNDTYDPTRSWFSRDERFLADINGSPIATISATSPEVLHPVASCDDPYSQPSGTKQLTTVMRYSSTDTSICDYIALPKLRHDMAYLVRLTTKHIAGFPLELCINNDLTKHCDVFVHLQQRNAWETETFYLPILHDHGLGYTLNFNNFTIRKSTSINEIQNISVSVIPNSSFFSNNGVIPDLPAPYAGIRDPGITSTKLHPSSFLATLPANTSGILTFDQSFEDGWTAWDISGNSQNIFAQMFPYLFGKKLDQHVLVNNWENGWIIPSQNSETTIVIFFLPQLLEWIGFILLPLPFLIAWKKKDQT